jgi:hypothetical protein
MHPIKATIDVVCDGCGAETPAKAMHGEMNLRAVVEADPAWLVFVPGRDPDHADPRTKTLKGINKQSVLCPTCLADPPPTPDYPDLAAMRSRKP